MASGNITVSIYFDRIVRMCPTSPTGNKYPDSRTLAAKLI